MKSGYVRLLILRVIGFFAFLGGIVFVFGSLLQLPYTGTFAAITTTLTSITLSFGWAVGFLAMIYKTKIQDILDKFLKVEEVNN